MSNILRQFNIKGTVADIVDEEARSELEVQSEFTSTMQSEVESEALAISELGSEVDSQSVLYSEMFSEIDTDFTLKQNVLNKGVYTGNIDDLITSNDVNGCYLFSTSIASGTMPSSSGYYYLIVVSGVQIACQYNSGATGSTIIAYRIYLNRAWTVWRSATFTV